MSTRIGIHALLRAGAFCAAAALTSDGLAAEADTSEVPRPSAEALFPSPPTAPRFRGAVGLAAGALLAPESSSLLTIEVEGQLGIQYNDRLGLVVIPSLGAGLLDTLGLFAGLGLLADYTLDDSFSVGVGPECVGLLAAFEDRTSILGYRYDGGGLRGGRARLTWTPLLARTANGTRKASARLRSARARRDADRAVRREQLRSRRDLRDMVELVNKLPGVLRADRRPASGGGATGYVIVMTIRKSIDSIGK